ncbi:Bifunctional epoxide hydrolase 2 [Penicillium cataractarum]|uniref:Bifunctional epoxide hydrolase 2 n=1 Tax=Penicillium cataractarum TaxID=2100454 RepID=A0A9W9V1V2_9EURO|nr:Bifunctional epoxide hydrolase 2 [Penicillium cataractarum]KAJ5364629.1 Bifunctional epoxide hydrolase 2 [Penicillium cataractarum]
MNLSTLTKKTITVSRGFTYTYYFSPARNSKPSIILFHGWPDSAQLWSGLINDYLLPQGYGIVAPDCLGYGETSKPTDPKSYSWKELAADAIEILDAEQLSSVIATGHDWGSSVSQRLYNFHPSRVSGVITINVAYMPPIGHFSLDAMNEMTRRQYGYGILEYWYFFTTEEGVQCMNQNLESVYCMAYGDPSTWLDTMTAPGGARKFVSEGRTQPTLPFATAEHKKDFMDRFGKEGGFEAPSCWYRAYAFDVQGEADRQVSDENKVIRVPVLYWGGEGDIVGRPDRLKPPIDAGLLPDVKSITREGGHWALLERPDVFGEDILNWLEERFA